MQTESRHQLLGGGGGVTPGHWGSSHCRDGTPNQCTRRHQHSSVQCPGAQVTTIKECLRVGWKCNIRGKVFFFPLNHHHYYYHHYYYLHYYYEYCLTSFNSKNKPIHSLSRDADAVALTCVSFYPPPRAHSFLHSFIRPQLESEGFFCGKTF